MVLFVAQFYYATTHMTYLTEELFFHPSARIHVITGVIWCAFVRVCVCPLLFQSITITLDLMDVLEELRKTHPGLKVSHGGLGGVEARAESEKQKDPMVLVKQYIDRANLRLVDFFNSIDKDKSMTVTIEEFEVGLAVSSDIHHKRIDLYVFAT